MLLQGCLHSPAAGNDKMSPASSFVSAFPRTKTGGLHSYEMQQSKGTNMLELELQLLQRVRYQCQYDRRMCRLEECQPPIRTLSRNPFVRMRASEMELESPVPGR
jgi:hypothetical protein